MTSDGGRLDQQRTLTQILTQVAEGRLSVAEAEKLIQHSPSRRSPLLIVGLVFLVIGSVSAAVGIVIGQSNWSFASNALETEGTVIRMVATGKRGTLPIVRYEVDGKSFEFQSSVSSSPPRHAVGDKVTILYHADEPHKGTIRSFMDQWLIATIFTGIGILFVLIGVAACLRAMRRVVSPKPPNI